MAAGVLVMLEVGEQMDLLQLEAELERSLAVDSFRDYATAAYPIVTGVPLRPNHAVDGLVETLHAIGTGQLRRTLIEIGPGLSKSTLLVCYSGWRLARNGGHRAIHGSHAFDLAARDSRRARRLVESEWHGSRFGTRLRADESTVAHWATVNDGRYIAVGVGGSLTGHRAHEVVVDDALNAIDAHSKAARDQCATWFSEGLLTRIDQDGAVTVVGQRLGTDDLAGRLRETGAWTCVTLPAEFDSRRRCVVVGINGAEVWRDTRETDGDLAAPDVLSREKLAELKIAIGSASYQSQFNQLPSSDETSVCPAKWWRFYRAPHAAEGQKRPIDCDDGPAVELPSRPGPITIGIDLTFGSTSKTADYSVAVAVLRVGGAFYVIDLVRRRCGFDEQLAIIKGMVERHPGARVVCEKAANGHAVADTLRKSLPNVVLVPAQGSKLQRFSAVTPLIENGSVFLCEGAAYLPDLVDECRALGHGRHDDIPDALGYAIQDLSVRQQHQPVAMMPMVGTIGTDRGPSGITVYGGTFSIARRDERDDPLPPMGPLDGRVW